MIPDQQFLSQEQVATTVLTLADDAQAKILNGKIIPGDRVFYPVKSYIRSSVTESELHGYIDEANYLQDKNVIIEHYYYDFDEIKERLENLNALLFECGAHVEGPDAHCMCGCEKVFEKTDLVIYFTGNLPNFSNLTDLSRKKWDELVDKFINRPATNAQEALEHFVPGGSDDPRKFKDAEGRIVIVGPDLPVGKKISGHERAKIEVFRGALRPFATTVNQELSDVLKSNVRVFLILPGTVDGKEPNDENIVNTLNYLMSDESGSSSEVIFCPDETR
jgi:hypothetical protein